MKLLSRWFGQDEEAVSREEPAFKTAVERSYSPDEWYSEFGRAENSVTGIHVSRATALNASAVMAAVTMLAEDVAKLPWSLWKSEEGRAKTEAKGHFLYDLLQEPNEWQNGLEFREILQVGLILRGNAYAPIFRTPRGEPYRLFPINPDWVSLWLANDGKLFWRITTADLFTQSVMSDHPFYAATGMIPYEDMLHIRGFSVSGLVGASRISLARDDRPRSGSGTASGALDGERREAERDAHDGAETRHRYGQEIGVGLQRGVGRSAELGQGHRGRAGFEVRRVRHDVVGS